MPLTRTRSIIAMLTLALAAAGAAAAGGSVHDENTETDPYCETTANGAHEDDADAVTAGPATATTCEGEHWDGQDTLAGEFNDEDPCSGQHVDVFGGREDYYNVAAFQCADPARHAESQVPGVAGARVSYHAETLALNHAGVYGAARVTGVGTVAFFAMGCTAGEDSHEVGHAEGHHHEGEEEAEEQHCQGETGHGVLALYWQDGTPASANAVYAALAALGVFPGAVGEGDCSHEAYEHGECLRDNTAVTAEILA